MSEYAGVFAPDIVDTLTGNGGADVFVFATRDSGASYGARDLISDFTPGTDQVDLTGIDANSGVSGINAFRFLDTAAFDGTVGALHTVYDAGHNVTVLEGDVNGDRVADFGIELAGNQTLTMADFTAGSLLLPVNQTGSGALTGGELNDTLSGLGGNDTLTGLGGNDYLDGGAGADIMIGGKGNDTYVVDNAGDVVTEASGFTAPAGWTLVGTTDFNRDGNLDAVMTDGVSLNQIWYLNAGVVQSIKALPYWAGWPVIGIADLNGDGNKDILYQSTADGRQDGVYLNASQVQIADVILSGKTPDALQAIPGNEGTDTVISSVNYTLGAGVENLTLASGAGAINGTGNAADNVIVGNEAANILNGKGGLDTLTGNGGADVFVFATPTNAISRW